MSDDSTNPVDDGTYELERNSRIMSYWPGGDSIGGMVDAIELSLDEISDDHFEEVKAIIEMIRARNFSYNTDRETYDMRWHIEIGPKGTKAHELQTIFGSAAFQVLPNEVFQLQRTLRNAIRDAHTNPPPKPVMN